MCPMGLQACAAPPARALNTRKRCTPLGPLQASPRSKITLHTSVPPVMEDLQPQVVNGIRAKGSRVTMTIPKGAFGNDRDVKVVNERWYSDDLQILLKSSNSDPRFGVTTYELTNI